MELEQCELCCPAAGIPDAKHSRSWFALMVRPQRERMVSWILSNKELETYLPCYRTRHVWSDRMKEMDVPLFPGYVFCRFQLGSRVAVLNTPGVQSIVGLGREPVPVPEDDIAGIRSMLASGFPVQPWPFLKQGQRVRVECGPLQGLEGILVQFKGAWRVVLTVELLHRSVAVEIDRNSISRA